MDMTDSFHNDRARGIAPYMKLYVLMTAGSIYKIAHMTAADGRVSWCLASWTTEIIGNRPPLSQISVLYPPCRIRSGGEDLLLAYNYYSHAPAY